jgi:predicted trehalose synthase
MGFIPVQRVVHGVQRAVADAVAFAALQRGRFGPDRALLRADFSQLTTYLRSARWFDAKDQNIKGVRVRSFTRVELGGDFDKGQYYFAQIKVTGERHRVLGFYNTALKLNPNGTVEEVFKPDGDSKELGAEAQAFAHWLRSAALGQAEGLSAQVTAQGRSFERSAADEVSFLVDEMRASNTILVFKRGGVNREVLKLNRTFQPIATPDPEVRNLLTLAEKGFKHTGTVHGVLEIWRGKTRKAAGAILTGFVPNEGTSGAAFERDVESGNPEKAIGRSGQEGQVILQFHRDLATGAEMRPENLRTVLAEVTDQLAKAEALPKEGNEEFLKALPTLRAFLDSLKTLDVSKLRVFKSWQPIHGDLHHYQMLDALDGPSVMDPAGETMLPIWKRAQPSTVARDVAGMLRSFTYMQGKPGLLADTAKTGADRWMSGYLGEAEMTAEDQKLLLAELIRKAAYEVVYEKKNRPNTEFPGVVQRSFPGLVAQVQASV